MTLSRAYLGSLVLTAIVGGVGLWWWSGRAPPPPPRSADPPPLPPRPTGPAPLPAVRSTPPITGAEAFDLYVQRPDAELDVAAGALLLAREDDPTVRPVDVLERFDAWCADVAEVCRAAEDPETMVDRFLAAAFGAAGLSFDADDPEGRHPDGWQFDRVFERRIGVCMGLALVVQAAADRCGVPCAPVALPNHVFLRVDSGYGRWRNVEVTAQGAGRSDAEYRNRYGVPEVVDGSIYLSDCGRRGLLALLCVNVAAWHLDERRPERALANAERALTLFPGLPAAHANRATALLVLQRPREAEAAAGEAIAVHPDMQTALVVRGAARFDLGEAGPAARDFARALELQPLDVDARLGLARARLALGEWDAAEADFRAVLQVRTDSEPALYGLAEALWQKKDVAAAAPVLAKLAERRPNDAPLALLAGQVFLAMGDEPTAERHWRRYLTLGGDRADVREWLATRE